MTHKHSEADLAAMGEIEDKLRGRIMDLEAQLAEALTEAERLKAPVDGMIREIEGWKRLLGIACEENKAAETRAAAAEAALTACQAERDAAVALELTYWCRCMAQDMAPEEGRALTARAQTMKAVLDAAVKWQETWFPHENPSFGGCPEVVRHTRDDAPITHQQLAAGIRALRKNTPS